MTECRFDHGPPRAGGDGFQFFGLDAVWCIPRTSDCGDGHAAELETGRFSRLPERSLYLLDCGLLGSGPLERYDELEPVAPRVVYVKSSLARNLGLGGPSWFDPSRCHGVGEAIECST